MGILLGGVKWVANTVHTTLSIAGERDSSGNVYAMRALEGATRIIRGVGANFFCADALVQLHSTLRPASSIYGAYSSIFSQWNGTIESIKKTCKAVFDGEKEVTIKSKVNVSHVVDEAARPIVTGSLEFKNKSSVADWKDRTIICLGVATSVSGYIFSLTHSAAELLKIEQVAAVASQALRPLMLVHKEAARVFTVINLTGSFVGLSISALRVYQASNALPTELARLKAERYQSFLNLIKNVMKAALLILSAHFSLIAQGIMILSVLAVDIYLSRRSTKEQVEESVDIQQPGTYLPVQLQVYQKLTV